jgi:hypothetical protein
MYISAVILSKIPADVLELLGFHWVWDHVSGQTRDKVWSSPGYGEHQLGPQSHFQFAQLCFRVTNMSVANEMSILKIKVLSSLSPSVS